MYHGRLNIEDEKKENRLSKHEQMKKTNNIYIMMRRKQTNTQKCSLSLFVNEKSILSNILDKLAQRQTTDTLH